MKKIILALIATFGILAGAQASESGLVWDKARPAARDAA